MNRRFLYSIALSFILIFLVLFGQLFSPNASAQGAKPSLTPDPFGRVDRPGGAPTYNTQGSVLLLTVHDDTGALLDRQAVVKLSNKNDLSVIWQTTEDKPVATFEDVPFGAYDIEVSALGYLTTHQELKADWQLHSYHLDVLIKPDPTAVELRTPVAAQMPSKARKQINRAVTDLKSGNWKAAKKRLDAAYKLVPSNSEVNFLLGYLFFQTKKFEEARSSLDKAIAADPHNVQALTLSGRMYGRSEDFVEASKVLEQAVAADADYWMAHYRLAESYLRLNEFDKAREQAQAAVERGKGNGEVAQVTLGEALASLGRDAEAIQTLNAFLREMPESPSAPGIRELVATLEQREASQAVSSEKLPPQTVQLAEVDHFLSSASPAHPKESFPFRPGSRRASMT